MAWDFPGGSNGKEPACNAGEPGSVPGSVRKIPWRREWQATPVFLPGEFHGQRSLVDYGPWGHKESDTTEGLTFTPWWVWARFTSSTLGGLTKTFHQLVYVAMRMHISA